MKKLLLKIKNLKRYQLVLGVVAAMIAVPNVVQAFGGLEIGVMLLYLVSRLTGYAGILLNLAVVELVFEMGTKMRFSFGASVENSWSVIRDLMNLAFIFSLVYIGFQVILDASSSHARRLLPPLIIAALLINFSLFFSKAIVDITNVAATEIYMTVGFAGVPSETFSGTDSADNTLISVGMSGAFMQIMGLKDLLSPRYGQVPDTSEDYRAAFLEGACAEESGRSGENQTACTITSFVFFMVAIIFMLVAAYAFAVGAFMLLWRFVTLIVLMIFSPLMFAGMIFPKAARFQSQWWSTFLNAAFFAPAYMLMMYIAYAVASRAGVQSTDDAWFPAANGVYESVDVILNYLIVIGFMLAAVWVGKQMSSYGARGTMNFVDNVRRRGQRVIAGATLGGAAYAGRQTIGKSADAYSKDEKRVELSQGKGMRAWIARQQLAAAANVSGRSFDVRQSLNKKAQDQVGTGQKGGYAQKIKDREKADKERAKLFGSSDGAVYQDYGVESELANYKELEKKRSTAEKELAALKRTPENKEARAALIRTIQTASVDISAMEKGQATESQKYTLKQKYSKWDTWRNYIDANGELNKEDWEKERKIKLAERDEAIKNSNAQFAAAKRAEKGYGARRWANNRETAWTEGPLNQTIGWLFTDSYARKAGAKAVKKDNAQKGADQRLKDVIKEIGEADSASTPAPTPTPDSDASAT